MSLNRETKALETRICVQELVDTELVSMAACTSRLKKESYAIDA